MQYMHISKWTLPRDYFGARWDDYYSAGVGCSRDSDALERANFAAMLAALGGETGEGDDGVAMVCVVTENHWAVGWIKWIAVHGSNAEALARADRIMAKLEDYPVIDEELWSRFEGEDCEQTWQNCFDARERVDYFRRNSFTSNGIGALLRAIRGSWAEAANMLHSPSDLIA